MRKAIFSAIALSFLATGMASAASHVSTGVIETINSRTATVRLINGDQYVLPAGTDISSLRGGEKVSIGWQTQDSSSIQTFQARNELPVRVLQADSITLAR